MRHPPRNPSEGSRTKVWILAVAALRGVSTKGAHVHAEQGVGMILTVQTRVTISCFPLPELPSVLRLRAANLWRLILVEVSDAP
jgi:hypothetical protein